MAERKKLDHEKFFNMIEQALQENEIVINQLKRQDRNER